LYASPSSPQSGIQKKAQQLVSYWVVALLAHTQQLFKMHCGRSPFCAWLFCCLLDFLGGKSTDCCCGERNNDDTPTVIDRRRYTRPLSLSCRSGAADRYWPDMLCPIRFKLDSLGCADRRKRDSMGIKSSRWANLPAADRPAERAKATPKVEMCQKTTN